MKRILLLALLLPCAARAQALAWEQTRTAMKVVQGGDKGTSEFRFKNTSAQPVRIKWVTESCNCVAAKPEKRDYAPGETGVLPLTYTPKGSPGARAYRLFVITDEKGIRPYELKLEVTEVAKDRAAD